MGVLYTITLHLLVNIVLTTLSATKLELLRGDTLEETYVGVGEKGEESIILCLYFNIKFKCNKIKL